MIGPDYAQLMASYNRWQNENLYEAAHGLSEHDRTEDLGAFFGSIEATLNHILWADRIWMSRFAGWSAPRKNDIPGSVGEAGDWEHLRSERAAFDRDLVAWADALSADDLAGDFTWYSGATGREWTQPLWRLITHLFNHQTHHRGQVHAMLTAKGAKPHDTDIPFMPEDARR